MPDQEVNSDDSFGQSRVTSYHRTLSVPRVLHVNGEMAILSILDLVPAEYVPSALEEQACFLDAAHS